ncbi:hypothetical protein F4775DRAFT_574315 [Biscogniauxia sp. FL1348]|nr:hypothetical protein F4775DRAFT_574315 [Biscogniauxia sp. FL1348]
MVGLIGRFRKPKPPITLGSPEKDDAIPPQTPVTPQNPAPPVPRNFSYPTSIGNNTPSAAVSHPPKGGQSTWDQLGEICSFAPDSNSRIGQAGSTGIEDPFFFKSYRASYYPLINQDNDSVERPQSERQDRPTAPSAEEPKARKKQRRSTLLGLSTSEVQNARLYKRNERSEPREKPSKLPKSQSIGDHIFSQKSAVVAKLKRNSLGQHKTTSSLNTSHFIYLPYTGLERPVSSSGIPLIDTRLKHSSSTSRVSHSPLAIPQEGLQDFSAGLKEELRIVEVASGQKSLQTDSTHRKVTSHSQLGAATDASGNIGARKRSISVSEPAKSRGKLGKSRWLSQLKDWVSISEPSDQALKHYPQGTHQKPGAALDDPRANAKLHPLGATLPSDVSKPEGLASNRVEVGFKRAEQRRKMGESLTGIGETSRGSRSSSSHHSSSSTVALRSFREDI